MLMLQLLGINLISSQGLLSMQMLQLQRQNSQQPEASCLGSAVTAWELSIKSQTLPPVQFLQLPGSNQICSQGFARELGLLQLLGQNNPQPEASCLCFAATAWELLIKSQTLPPMQPLQLPGSNQIRNHGLASMLVLQLYGQCNKQPGSRSILLMLVLQLPRSNVITNQGLASMLLLHMPGSILI